MATNLLNQLITKDTIAQLAKSTKADEGQVESLLTSALPVLMQNMANNASTKEGKDSLAKALSQHAAQTNTTNVTTLLKQADTNDGEKILGHLLGGSKNDITDALAAKSGLSNKNTLMLLATLAPVLMGLVGNEKEKSAKKDDGLDLGDLISVMGGLGGKKKSGGIDLLDLAGDLLADDSSSNKKKKSSGIDLLDLAGDLLADDSSSKKKKKKSSDNTAEMVGDLLGKLLK
ncbi:MAG: DUF937 domain-containing protein [Oscillospiraceae bacterium]|nr:DUF937 domain-containing protein [Oscillospiraceae bacterium]